MLKPIPFKQLLITLHFHNKQTKSPIRTLRRHIEKWGFGSTPSRISTSKVVYGGLCSASCHGRFIPAKWVPPHTFTRRSDGLHCRCKQVGEEKRLLPALLIVKRFDGVQPQPGRFTDWDIAAPLEWRTVPIILSNCWQMAAHYSLIPYHVLRSVDLDKVQYVHLLNCYTERQLRSFPPTHFME